MENGSHDGEGFEMFLLFNILTKDAHWWLCHHSQNALSNKPWKTLYYISLLNEKIDITIKEISQMDNSYLN